MIRLAAITSENIWDVVKLSVHDGQKTFVATNTSSILEAYLAVTSGHVALPFAVYADDTLVGFVMFGYGSAGDADEPQIAAGNYTIWRFMIDRKYQGMGYGKEALAASLDYIRTLPCGEAAYCWLSYAPDNARAKKLYHSAGFAENGEIDDDEIVAVLKL
jgi:diamine N-acetyltransferase